MKNSSIFKNFQKNDFSKENDKKEENITILNKNIQTIENAENLFINTIGKDWQIAKNSTTKLVENGEKTSKTLGEAENLNRNENIMENYNIFDLKNFINNTNQHDSSTNPSSNDQQYDRKRVIFDDIENASDIPQSFSVTHEFSNFVQNGKNTSNFQKKENSYEKQKNNQINLDLKTNKKAENLIENKNLLDIKSSMEIMNKLSNKTMEMMSNLSIKDCKTSKNESLSKEKSDLIRKSLDFFNNFRFQDHKIVSFLQFSQNINNINQNNINVINNMNIMTDVTVSNCSDNCNNNSNNNNTNNTHLTYYDIKHPTTKKIIDRNKGTITTITDLGNFIYYNIFS